MVRESIRWRSQLIVRKWELFPVRRLVDVIHVRESNMLLSAGMARLRALTLGAEVEALHSESVRFGMGDSDEPVSGGDTSLGDNEFYRVLDDGFPVEADGAMRFRATFGVDDGNFAWASWGLDVSDDPPVTSGDTPNTLLNRQVVNLGTKDGGEWDLTAIVHFEQ